MGVFHKSGGPPFQSGGGVYTLVMKDPWEHLKSHKHVETYSDIKNKIMSQKLYQNKCGTFVYSLINYALTLLWKTLAQF